MIQGSAGEGGDNCDVFDHGTNEFTMFMLLVYRCITFNSIYMIAALSLSCSLVSSLSLSQCLSLRFIKINYTFSPLSYTYPYVCIFIYLSIYKLYFLYFSHCFSSLLFSLLLGSATSAFYSLLFSSLFTFDLFDSMGE